MDPEAALRPLTVYSNSLTEERAAWLVEAAAEVGFDVQTLNMGGGDLTNRILSEVANPVADVVFGLNQVFFERLVAADVFEEFTPAWADLVTPDAGTERGLFWPIAQEATMLVYDTAAFPDGDGPTDWPDLWNDERFHGRHHLADHLGGANTQMALTGILYRYRDDSAELGVAPEGWAAIQAFFATVSRGVPGEDMFARFANEEVVAGPMWCAGLPPREATYGITAGAARPEIGVPMVFQSIGIINGTAHRETAHDFVDWFGSAEVQAAWSREFFTVPTNRDALPTANPDAVALTTSFGVQDIDWLFVTEHLDSWVEHIELQYAG